jgi:hypothetical protein
MYSTTFLMPVKRGEFGISLYSKVVVELWHHGESPQNRTTFHFLTLNGTPMTTLDRLRSTLKSLPPGTAVAMQIQLFVTQPL